MSISKDIVYGLEQRIYLLQYHLNDNLAWFDNVSDSKIEIYGKIQPTQKNINGTIATIPEVPISKKDYKNPFINDNTSGIIAFLVQNRTIGTYLNKATLKAIFTVKLTEIHNDNERNQERALSEAYKALDSSDLCDIIGVEEHIPTVFSSFRQDEIRFRDMQPWFVFAYIITVDYEDYLCSGGYDHD